MLSCWGPSICRFQWESRRDCCGGGGAVQGAFWWQGLLSLCSASCPCVLFALSFWIPILWALGLSHKSPSYLLWFSSPYFSPWVLENLMLMDFNSLIYSLISHSSWPGLEPFRAGVRNFSVPRDAGAAVNHGPNSRAHTGSTLENHRTASPWVRWYFQIEICDFFPGQSFPWDILGELEVFFSSFRIMSSEHRDRILMCILSQTFPSLDRVRKIGAKIKEKQRQVKLQNKVDYITWASESIYAWS